MNIELMNKPNVTKISELLKSKTDYDENCRNDLAKEIKEIIESYHILCNKVTRSMIHYGYSEEKFQDLNFYLENQVFGCIENLV